ncbi:MAG: methyltransferase domain-containing protein [Gammaproteobacteria bacterium]|nr:methyltransferase domain-containing protein [Gammaproteobacteria bacterium]MDH4256134.1 methyltransferase domain-containing protein [Gammaproteobacteria bacterium]MDH5310619.1 methyltransferase domain-containing protein [Gammaproteobacteria bacterium]
MAHENEYHDNLVKMLELVWGEGYMAPGGPGNVARLFAGLETRNKRVLDIGCGIGGPAFEMARSHGARVVGIDLEAPLIDKARAAAKGLGLDDRCEFLAVEHGPLPFPDESFDIVATSGALTQTADKAAVYSECLRILKPGGWFTCYDWMKAEGELSEDMHYWFKMEGLTYALATLDDYVRDLGRAGFESVSAEDASDWYRVESRREYELIKGELYPRMAELLGQRDADHFVENWRALVVVCEQGEMKQGYCRGRKPG